MLVKSERERVASRYLRDKVRLQSLHLLRLLSGPAVAQLLEVVVATRVDRAVLEQEQRVVDAAGHLSDAAVDLLSTEVFV